MLQEKLEALRLKVNVVKSETVWRKKKKNHLQMKWLLKIRGLFVFLIIPYFFIVICKLLTNQKQIWKQSEQNE